MMSNAFPIDPRGTRGFWSYVHKDDDAEHGRISQLPRDVSDQFELLTGETLRIVPNATAEYKPIEQLDDTSGFLDRFAAAEEAFPKLNETLTLITANMEQVAGLADDATFELKRADKQAPGFAAPLLISRRLAHRLAEPAARIPWAAADYTSQLHDIDDGLRPLIALAVARASQDQEAKKVACEFFAQVRHGFGSLTPQI